jgi:glycosyltransferase involved in cell wall biosynthesis
MTALHSYYHKAHLFIFPSTSEGWPKVLSEAMAHGVVPIASAIASIPEILEGADAGLALPPEDIEAFVDAVIMYTQDVKAWKKASLNGIRAASNFTYEYYLSSVKDMYRRAWSLDLNDE